MAEPSSASAEAVASSSTNMATQLRVAGAWSGQINAHLDTWTISDLRLHLSALSGFSLDSINLICAGKVLKDQTPGTLQKVGIGPKSKILMTHVAAHQQPTALLAEEERQARLMRIKAAADAIVKRSNSDEFSDDHYDLQLENQSGEQLQFKSESDRRALMLGLMLHAKARDILQQNSYGEALEVLNMAEEAFGLCDPKFLEAVDNVALLQLDTVWCYFMLQDMAKLADAGKRLAQAREGLRQSHGPHLERLRTLQGGFCPELAIYVRLELLEGVIAYHRGLYETAKKSMVSAQSKYNQLQVSDESLALLVSMGFSTKDSQRALRVSGQDVNSAIEFAMEEKRRQTSRREEDRRLEKRRRELKSYGTTASGKVVDSSKLNELVTIGYEKLLAAEALRQNENDFNAALDILANPATNAALQSTILAKRERPRKRLNDESIQHLLSMGFHHDQAVQALQNTSDMNEAIAQLLCGGTTEAAGAVAESSSGVFRNNGVHLGGEDEAAAGDQNNVVDKGIKDDRDLEMEEDIATKLSGDPLAEYDIDVHREGEAILNYLALSDAKIRA